MSFQNVDTIFCSKLSKEQEVDPSWSKLPDKIMGYLIFEFDDEWGKFVEETPSFPIELKDLFKEAKNLGFDFKHICIKSDLEYTPTGKIKVIFYEIVSYPFSKLKKYEYNIYKEDLINLIEKLIINRTGLDSFDEFRVTEEYEDFFVCNHINRDNCCATFGKGIYAKLKELTKERENVRIWKSSHLSGHRFAPTMIEFPYGKFWSYLDNDVLHSIINHKPNPSEISDHYRGNIGLDPYSQILEKYILVKYGWELSFYKKENRIIENNTDDKLVEIKIYTDNKVKTFKANIVNTGKIHIPKSSCSDETSFPKYNIRNFMEIS